MRPARLHTLLAATLAIAALAAPVANAAPGDNFGFADINDGAGPHPEVAAYPGQEAVWAGTCDLASGSTTGGGAGTAPAIRSHCTDVGGLPEGTPDTASPWAHGEEPAWRLDPVTQAGAHPDAAAAFYFNHIPASPFMDGTVKNIIAALPRGVVGNPEAVVKCSSLAAQAFPPECPAAAQGGIATVAYAQLFQAGPLHNTHPVYLSEARDTVTAELLIAAVGGLVSVPITARGRTNGDYGVDTLALLIPDYLELAGQTITLWGVPWAAEHDKFRIDGFDLATGLSSFDKNKNVHLQGYDAELHAPYDPAWGPIKPFFTNPTECSGEKLVTTISMDSWQNPQARGGPLIEGTTLAEPVTACGELEFEPSITLKPTVSVSDSPSGLDVTLKTPQNNDPPAEALGNPNLPFDPADDTGAPAYWKTPAGRGTAHLKDTTVSLPAGTSFNPAAANGLRGCTTAQIGLTATSPKATFNNDPHQCPDTSKVGTLEIKSPLLPDPLFGAVYAAPQHDNPFPGSLTAIYLVAQDDERGLSIKLPGKVDLDPDSGQISTTFLDNPQLPFDEFVLHLKSGPRAPLNTPAVCGSFKNSVSLIPWSFPQSGPEPVIEDPFSIAKAPNSQPCVSEPEDRLFSPGFQAGSISSQAKSHTDFTMDVTRIDGQQEFSSLSVDLPEGLSANLTETPYCPEHLIEAAKLRSGLQESLDPSCPPASRMGHVTALAGAGPLPLPTEGQLYIAGPHDPDGAGPRPLAPSSKAAVAPAIAGGTPSQPAFDLGNVVIRSAGYVDPRTAKVNIASTPVPYIVGGVPLRIRHIQVSITKPQFMLNPTDCDPMEVGGTIGGAADPFDPSDDSSFGASSPFQVGGCRALGFKPKLHLRLFGKTRRGANPRLRAVLIPRPQDANFQRAAVTLPPSAFLDQSHLDTICTRVQFAASHQCPKGSIVGFARAFTPLLRDPVQGPVYLRSSDNPLPDMVAHLEGQFDVELIGRIDSVRRGIRSTFDVLPDAPVSKFVLNMRGGSKSLIVNSRNLCKSPGRATVNLRAQNGRRLVERPRVRNSCEKRRGKGKKRRRGGHRRAGRR
ncbi:MAG: hypothetical protein WD404_07565 [Solirubrobacterales bacterium]